MKTENLHCSLGAYSIYGALTQDASAALKKAADCGYSSIEYFGEPDIAPQVLKTMLCDAGLRLNGWHIEWRHLQPETIAETIDYCHAVGLKRVIVPCLGGQWEVAHTHAEECKEVWQRYAKRFTELSTIFAAEGIEFGYHNHNHEFALSYDGKTVFELLFDSLPPEIIIELDTGNAIEGGADPVKFIRRYSQMGRKILIHAKPYSKKKGFDVTLGDPDDDNDWTGIFRAFDTRETEIIIECESQARPPFALIEDSLAAVKALWKEA